MGNLYQSYRSYKKRQQFQPGVLGLFKNPFYAARKGLFDAMESFASDLSGRVLDVGCGQKPYIGLFPGTDYVGMELDTPENRSDKKADCFYDGKVFPFPDSSFDSVICNQVFEHVFNPADFLVELRRVLKPQGALLMTVPFAWDEHEQPWDFARYSSFGLRHLLESNGFEVVAQKKSVTGVKAVFQLLNGYIYKVTRPRYLGLRFKFVGTILFPVVNIAGEIAGTILPANEDLYLDNIILARKSLHA